MALFDALFLLLVIVGGAAAAVAVRRQSIRSRLIGRASPSVGIGPSDSLVAAAAKTQNYHRVVEAVRLFNEIQHQDRQIPILDERTRDAIEKFLDNYYKDN